MARIYLLMTGIWLALVNIPMRMPLLEGSGRVRLLWAWTDCTIPWEELVTKLVGVTSENNTPRAVSCSYRKWGHGRVFLRCREGRQTLREQTNGPLRASAWRVLELWRKSAGLLWYWGEFLLGLISYISIFLVHCRQFFGYCLVITSKLQ